MICKYYSYLILYMYIVTLFYIFKHFVKDIFYINFYFALFALSLVIKENAFCQLDVISITSTALKML